MYYRDPDGCVVGVLNDWDLATVVCDSTTPSTDRTGTIPFMALRLLTGHDVEHKYRHEAESFIWACAWVCACADGKKEMLVKPYATWRTLDMAQCAISREAFLGSMGSNLLERVNVHEHHQSNALLCIFLLSWLHEIHLRRWSEPANAETERKDIKVFRKLINELDAIRDILEIASQTPELRIFDYITDYARKFIAKNYPSNGTALLQDRVPQFAREPPAYEGLHEYPVEKEHLEAQRRLEIERLIAEAERKGYERGLEEASAKSNKGEQNASLG
jgi:Fungal protein kinase